MTGIYEGADFWHGWRRIKWHHDQLRITPRSKMQLWLKMLRPTVRMFWSREQQRMVVLVAIGYWMFMLNGEPIHETRKTYAEIYPT